ncbi:MAG TPA: glycosyltransferase domain-containing protein [Candidatus Acidoferrales bacterium]|nr:glycosyltransferase domain-containing protein [Candidatus Acidoferrales bacterium]
MAWSGNSEKQRLIVYTTIFGPYDHLKGHPFGAVKSLCFTDQPDETASGWEVIREERRFNSLDEQIREARRYKLLPHKVLPPHDVSIWIDASMRLVADPATMVSFLEDCGIATFQYPDTYGRRECLYQEAAACIANKKDDARVIRRQMAKYRRIGYPDNNGLVETTILVRRNTPEVNAFNEEWWRELSSGSRRDQLSLNFVAWKLGIKYAHLPGCRRGNPFANWSPHLGADQESALRDRQRRILRWLVERIAGRRAAAARREKLIVEHPELIENNHEHLLDRVAESVIARTIEGRIEFWNRRAEQLYGWKKEEAVGRLSHDLLRTRFPKPRDQIESELVHSGEWQGKLVHTKRDGGKVVVESRWILNFKRQGAVVEINRQAAADGQPNS